jgi:hypothetical protein
VTTERRRRLKGRKSSENTKALPRGGGLWTQEGRCRTSRIIPDLVLQTGHLSREENSFAGCDHLADTKTLNASKQDYHKKSTDFGFAVKQRQTEVKSDYRKKAGKVDAEYHQPGDAATFKSILSEYGKGGDVLGLVVGYSDEASSDVYRVADLVATRLASKHLDNARTPVSIAKAMQTQRICRAWGHSFARGFARVILDRVRDNLDPALAIWGASWTLTLSSTFSTRPRREKTILCDLFPDTPFRGYIRRHGQRFLHEHGERTHHLVFLFIEDLGFEVIKKKGADLVHGELGYINSLLLTLNGSCSRKFLNDRRSSVLFLRFFAFGHTGYLSKKTSRLQPSNRIKPFALTLEHKSLEFHSAPTE